MNTLEKQDNDLTESGLIFENICRLNDASGNVSSYFRALFFQGMVFNRQMLTRQLCKIIEAVFTIADVYGISQDDLMRESKGGRDEG